jgi:hypothetical protein
VGGVDVQEDMNRTRWVVTMTRRLEKGNPRPGKQESQGGGTAEDGREWEWGASRSEGRGYRGSGHWGGCP